MSRNLLDTHILQADEPAIPRRSPRHLGPPKRLAVCKRACYKGRLQRFETENGMSSAEFLRRYENDELPESLDYAEWIGEYRILTRLREKANAYREITFVH